jgi:hypothetical protein
LLTVIQPKCHFLFSATPSEKSSLPPKAIS